MGHRIIQSDSCLVLNYFFKNFVIKKCLFFICSEDEVWFGVASTEVKQISRLLFATVANKHINA